MSRLFFSVFTFLLFLQGVQAQNEAASTGRYTMQQLSPSEAIVQKETSEVEGFARKLTALKTAFTEKDASRIIGHEAYILRAMRDEADQLEVKAATAGASGATKARLEKMNQILGAFEAHAFNPEKPEDAKRDFVQLDDFLKIMQAELEELKNRH